MVACKIKGCKNRSDIKGSSQIFFFPFPKDPKILSEWVKLCEGSVTKTSRVCSSHFKPACYDKNVFERSKFASFGVGTLLPSAVPTENIGNTHHSPRLIMPKEMPEIQNNNLPNSNGTNIMWTMQNNQQLLLLQVLDGKNTQQNVSPMLLPTCKLLNSQSNLGVQLGETEPPAHVLDHQYANIKPISIQNDVPTMINSIESNIEISDKELITQLQNQLREKTHEKQCLQKQLKRLQTDTTTLVNKRVHDILKNVFSLKQIEKLLNPYKNKIQWSIEDILSAVSLQNISLKAYCYFRDNNYPLPGLSTIRKWSSQFNVTEGILTDVLFLMKYKAKSLSVFQKIVVLNFANSHILNKKYLICMARGLFYEWMQPVYYSFNKSLSVNVIKEIISAIYNAGYTVVAITRNFELSTARVWNDLNIGIKSTQQCYFMHPIISNYKIFVFPHESNLILLLRDKFMKNGFFMKDKRISAQCIEEIIKVSFQSGDSLGLARNLLEKYESDIEERSISRKMFSMTTAQSIIHYGEDGYINYGDWQEVANFCTLISKWSGMFNSKKKEYVQESEKPYGLLLEHQDSILDEIVKLMADVENTDTTSHLEEEIILGCFSLKQFFKYLQESFSIKEFPIHYILTNRLNSELLENFIIYLNHKDVGNEKQEIQISKFRNRLRKWILGRYPYDLWFNQNLKITEPALIDFNEKSNYAIIANEKHKLPIVRSTRKESRVKA